MSNNPNERRVTTDRDEIRNWVEQRDAIPASRAGGGGEATGTSTSGTSESTRGHEHTFVRRDDLGDEYEERTWEEFFEVFDDDDLVFVYHESESTGEGLESAELLEREAMMDRAALENERVEEALREGETVTTELVEPRVIEREVVEVDTIETELTDTEVLEREIVSSEILEREPIEVEFLTDETIEVLVEERRVDTIEELELLIVESRIVDVDVDVEEHEDSEVDEYETRVGDETVQRAILESDVVRSSADADADALLESDRIQTRRTEGDTIESRLAERRTIEKEVRDRRRLTFRLEETEIVETEVLESEVLETELVDVGEYDEEVGDVPGMAGGRPASSGAGVDSGTEAEARSDTGDVQADTEMDDGAHAGGQSTEPVELTADDQGKDVVDAAGEQVGIVADVEEDVIFIDPEPGFTDRLKARFDWGEPDRDAYPVELSEVQDVTDDEVVLRGSDDPDAHTGEETNR